MSTNPTTPKESKKLSIFLSYSSAQLILAEQVYIALTTSGHDVFFDRTSLLPGGEYHDAVHERIRTSDLFVFLISPESISPGHYARTELRYAQDTWRDPAGRILPVMVKETDFAAIPAYLKGVFILRPEGSVPAEVAAAVNDLAAGIGPTETFAEHIKLVKKTVAETSRLSRQQRMIEIEHDWREERESYRSNHKGIDISAIGAKRGAIVVGAISCLMAYFTYFGFGEFFPEVPFLVLLMGAVFTFLAYHFGRKFERAEKDYRDRLAEASSDQDADSGPDFSDFDELMRKSRK